MVFTIQFHLTNRRQSEIEISMTQNLVFLSAYCLAIILKEKYMLANYIFIIINYMFVRWEIRSDSLIVLSF